MLFRSVNGFGMFILISVSLVPYAMFTSSLAIFFGKMVEVDGNGGKGKEVNVLVFWVGLGSNRLNPYATNDWVSSSVGSMSSVASDTFSSACSGSGSDVESSSSAVSLGKPMFPVPRPSSGRVASVNSGESGQVASNSIGSGVNGWVDSQSGSSKSSASMKGNSLDVELESEFNPKVPHRLVGLDNVVAKVPRSKFQYIVCQLAFNSRSTDQDQRFGVR